MGDQAGNGEARRGAGAQGRWLQVKSGQKEGAVELRGAEFGTLERREGRGKTGRVVRAGGSVTLATLRARL